MTKLKLQNGIGARCSVIARFLHPRRMLSRYVEVCWLLCNSFHWWRKHSWRGRRNSAFAILNFCDASYLIKNYICWLTSHDKLHIKQIRFVCSTKPCVYYWIILYFKVARPHFFHVAHHMVVVGKNYLDSIIKKSLSDKLNNTIKRSFLFRL